MPAGLFSAWLHIVAAPSQRCGTLSNMFNCTSIACVYFTYTVENKHIQHIDATSYSPDTPFSTIWMSGVGEFVFSVQLSPIRHNHNIHKVTNLLNSMTGVY